MFEVIAPFRYGQLTADAARDGIAKMEKLRRAATRVFRPALSGSGIAVHDIQGHRAPNLPRLSMVQALVDVASAESAAAGNGAYYGGDHNAQLAIWDDGSTSYVSTGQYVTISVPYGRPILANEVVLCWHEIIRDVWLPAHTTETGIVRLTTTVPDASGLLYGFLQGFDPNTLKQFDAASVAVLDLNG